MPSGTIMKYFGHSEKDILVARGPSVTDAWDPDSWTPVLRFSHYATTNEYAVVRTQIYDYALREWRDDNAAG